MGDILFHFDTEDRKLLARYERGERLTNDELTAVAFLYELSGISRAPSDLQRSADGYGVEDGAKL